MREKAALRILAVTVLTSSDDADLVQAGYALTVNELVGRSAPRRRATSASTAWSVRRARQQSCAPSSGRKSRW